MVELMPWIFTTGWASGINPYLVVVALSLIDRVAGLAQIPDVFQRLDVLIISAVLCAVDMVADKIAYIDSTWDAIHTVIRPAVGTGLGLMLAGQADSMETAVLAATGGATALLSHLIKAGIRAGVNTSPEPASNVAVSTVEDVAVAGVMYTAVDHPWIAASTAGALLLVGLVVTSVVVYKLRSSYRRTAFYRFFADRS